jgi:hypothetical protein
MSERKDVLSSNSTPSREKVAVETGGVIHGGAGLAAAWPDATGTTKTRALNTSAHRVPGFILAAIDLLTLLPPLVNLLT